MDVHHWLDGFRTLLNQRRDAQTFRRRIAITPIDATHFEVDGVRYINFASNDYLGLSHHPRVVNALAKTPAAGSGAAGLISGYSEDHQRAEAAIAAWKQTESAVLFPSGYQANLAAIQTLAALGDVHRNGVRFLLDKLVHASLIDAVRASGAAFRIFPHNHISKLKRLLESADAEQLQIVVTESIFSMDGDSAELSAIAQLKSCHGFVLLLDEAHASGVYGEAGAGFAAELGLSASVDVSVVTLSKALGCGGGAVCGSTIFRDAILNFGRAYIYSTSVPPSVARTVCQAIGVLREEPDRQTRLRTVSKRVRDELRAAGFEIPLGDSPIVPIILGSAQAALAGAEMLKREGIYVVAIRPPTVAPAASRLRVTLCSQHSDGEIDRLLASLRAMRIAK